jgi:type II secretory pathway component PulK
MKLSQTLINIFVKPRLSTSWSKSTKAPSRGVALLLVTFVVALASIVVTNLAYSTYLASRANAVIERSLFAEYLMKSSANIAGAYLLADTDTIYDGPQEPWAQFQKGQGFPLQLLGIDEPNASMSVELISEKQKFPIKSVIQSGASKTNPNYVKPLNRDRLARLFEQLGFDTDVEEKEIAGPMKGRFFNSKQLVANFIDSISSDKESYTAPNFPQGIKSDLPANFFSNKVPDSIGQLRRIPGFTPRRMRKLEPLITKYNMKININFAPRPILKALSSQMSDGDISAIIDAREKKDGPIKGDRELQNIISAAVSDEISNGTDDIVEYDSNSDDPQNPEAYFQVISKVELGVKTYFMRAILIRDTSNKEITFRELQFY